MDPLPLQASLSKLMQETMSKLIGCDPSVLAEPEEDEEPSAAADAQEDGSLTPSNADDVD